MAVDPVEATISNPSIGAGAGCTRRHAPRVAD
jgi:hypothetical protein